MILNLTTSSQVGLLETCNRYHGFFQLLVYSFGPFFFGSVVSFDNNLSSKGVGDMASRLPKRGRPKAPGNKKKVIFRESTFNLWNERKANVGIVGLTNSQFAEVLLRQEQGSCPRCSNQNQEASHVRTSQRTSSTLFSFTTL